MPRAAARRSPRQDACRHRRCNARRREGTMKVLIAYGSTDGMTARIAERMAQTLRGAGHTVEVARTPAGVDPAGFDAVLVGGSVHAGGFQRSMRRFVRRHLQTL